MASSSKDCKPQEISIPVPYGHIAAQVWGPEDGLAVLAVHGWQDNSGTFDTLIPHLQPSFRVVAMDLPGHGFSSHKPHGCSYDNVEYVIDMRRVVDYMKWTRLTIIGHSLGGFLALLFAGTFPDMVKGLVILDLGNILIPVQKIPKFSGRHIEELLVLADKIHMNPPSHTEEEAIQKLVAQTFSSVNGSSAKILLKRGATYSSDGQKLTINRDVRVKLTRIKSVSAQMFGAYIARITCKVLMITAIWEGSKLFHADSDKKFALMEKHCPTLQHKEVIGTHHVHLNNPERVSPLINTFLIGMGQAKL